MRTLKQWMEEASKKIALEEVIPEEKETLLEIAKENEVEVRFADGWYLIECCGMPYAQTNDKSKVAGYISELF